VAALAATLFLTTTSALAAPPDSGSALLQMSLSLALVLALLFGTLWLMRRLRIGQSGAGGVVRVIASAAVGPRENVVVVEIGDEWLVLGVAPGNVRLLQTRPRGKAEAADGTAPAAFAARLLDAIRQPR
jgi:flagellar protein FliO/FliZ